MNLLSFRKSRPLDSTITTRSGHPIRFAATCFALGFALILVESLGSTAHAQTSQWTWMGGSNTIPLQCSTAACGQPGWYGTLQTPAVANIPAARSDAVTWTDKAGNLWLFGGYQDSEGFLGDLWKYTPSAGQWTWMGGGSTGSGNIFSGGPQGVYGTLGTAAAGNMPGPRALAGSWTDSQGNLWLFGGNGFDANGNLGPLNDLWKFSPPMNEWTWMGGNTTLFDSPIYGEAPQPGIYGTLGQPAATNAPGGRYSPTIWTDKSGNVWLYSGFGVDSRTTGIECYPNDLWEYNMSTGQWTWMGGDNLCSNYDAGWPGTFGSVGVFGSGNMPWSVVLASSWTDNNGNLWLFGGMGEDQTATGYTLNDMWEFEPSVNEWALMSDLSASDGGPGTGNYGTLGQAESGVLPGERTSAASWKDSNGNLWLFGGIGLASAYPVGGFGSLPNDLWEFNPATDEWAWIGGSNTDVCLSMSSGICINSGQVGTYGTLGAPSASSIPGGRQAAVSWVDSKGNFWLFGGFGFDANGTYGYLNDLWEYSLNGSQSGASPAPITAAPSLSLAAGNYTSPQSLTISDQMPDAVIYYTTNGTPPNSGSAIYAGPLTVSSPEAVEAVAIAPNDAASGMAYAAYTFTLPQAAEPVFSNGGGIYTSTPTVTITDATPGATIYYTLSGDTPTAASTVYSTPITVSATETLEAIAVAANYTNSPVASATYTINLPPTFTLQASPASITVGAGSQGSTVLTVNPQNGFGSNVSFSCSGLPAGASCSFSPATLDTSEDLSSVLTISTSSQSADRVAYRDSYFSATALGFAVCLFGLKRRRLQQTALLVVTFAGLALLCGCGRAQTPIGSGPGAVTSTVTITATSSLMQQTTSLSLTVN
jgi:Chitobiase/beta-hexosaminidase C-terminal domain/Galactose oxidase, central domain